MKKIAILATYVGEVNRGAETFVIELVKRLKEFYEIDVFSTQKCTQLDGNIKIIEVKKGFILKANEFLYNKSSFYKKICERVYYLIPDVCFQRKFSKKVFKEYIYENNYDLIFPNNGIWGAKLANRLRKYKNTPFIYTGHGGIGTGERLILGTNPNKYIALTERHFRWAKQYSDKVKKVYNGISIEQFKSDSRAKKDKLVLSVGALTEFKRHNLTINAIAKMNDDIKLLIVGDGEMRESINTYGKEKLKDRFSLTKVPYEKMKDVYKEASLFVLPSLDEPFGIVYLEAMASNIPIVAPDDDSRREIIGEAGLYCNCEDCTEYSEAINNALEIEWMNKPEEQARKFEWDNIIEQYKDIIEGIIN